MMLILSIILLKILSMVLLTLVSKLGPLGLLRTIGLDPVMTQEVVVLVP